MQAFQITLNLFACSSPLLTTLSLWFPFHRISPLHCLLLKTTGNNGSSLICQTVSGFLGNLDTGASCFEGWTLKTLFQALPKALLTELSSAQNHNQLLFFLAAHIQQYTCRCSSKSGLFWCLLFWLVQALIYLQVLKSFLLVHCNYFLLVFSCSYSKCIMILLSLVTLNEVVPCVALKVPATSCFDAGVVVPIPILALFLFTYNALVPELS